MSFDDIIKRDGWLDRLLLPDFYKDDAKQEDSA